MTASTSASPDAPAAAPAPRRVFLCDVAAEAAACPLDRGDASNGPWDGGADRLVGAAGDMTRLMGIVVAVELGGGGGGGDGNALVIDDGTGCLVRVELPAAAHAPPSAHHSSATGPSLGDLVDCLGYMRRGWDGTATATAAATLVAASVAVVSDPNAEVLRCLEISSAGPPPSSSSGGGPASFDSDGGGNAFVPDSIRSPASVRGDDVLRLIRAAASDGGVAERDLAVVLGPAVAGGGGAATGRCRADPPTSSSSTGAAMGALGRTLEGLQAEGHIYRRRSTAAATPGARGGGGGGGGGGGSGSTADPDRGGVYLPL